jgi:putative molybdopterin biosynthesis protein
MDKYPEILMKEILDLKEVAEYLGLNKRTVYNLVRKGEIPGTKIGRQWRVKKDSLEDLFRNPKKLQ